MGKRKRGVHDATTLPNGSIKKYVAEASHAPLSSTESAASGALRTTIQIVTGSYERVLHGITATIPHAALETTPTQDDSTSTVNFTDTFLFNAHASAIRCLAISPPSDSIDPQSQKVILASGGTDERINLYHLSTCPPPTGSKPALPNLAGSTVTENPRNRELGSLLHHSSSVSALHFPSRSKLLSAAEDNTIAICRTRDWTVLSTIKAPIPKPVGRPSGDTAAPGEVPAGVNDFAVHPSMKLMVSVGKGERCMRLWNLVTGKKAGVLNFDKELLQQAGEGRWGSEEGRKVEWDGEGEEFVVAFERGVVVFGMDSRPKARILPSPLTKIHQIRYMPHSKENILAISTEDGRILFYHTEPGSKTPAETPGDPLDLKEKSIKSAKIPSRTPTAQIGGRAAGISGRIKDFEVLESETDGNETKVRMLILTASSDGAVRLWTLDMDELRPQKDDPASEEEPLKANGTSDAQPTNGAATPRQVGRLIGTYETGNRITCLKAFVMTGTAEELGERDDADGVSESDEETSSDDDGE